MTALLINCATSFGIGLLVSVLFSRYAYRRGLRDGLQVSHDQITKLFPLMRAKGVTEIDLYKALAAGETLRN